MIRKASLNDKNTYVLMAEAFYSSAAVAHSIPKSFIEETFDKLVSGSDLGDIYICEDEDKVVGYLLTAKTWSQEGGGIVSWIEEFFVPEIYRGRGYGTEMIKYVIQNEKAARFRLEVEPENEKAVSLYKRLGFSFMDYSSMVKELKYK